MADQEQVKRLKQGVEGWNRWRALLVCAGGDEGRAQAL
jgi:hypothetical protein